MDFPYTVKALVLMLRQDDPSKCTAAKLAKFRLAEPVRYSGQSNLVLDPFAKVILTSSDRAIADSVLAVDCSWERIEEPRNLIRFTKGIRRRLPALLAANPINYAKLNKLSSAEALAAALYILDEKSLAASIMDKFKWGHTFLELNSEPLNDYAKAETTTDMMRLELEYFPNLPS